MCPSGRGELTRGQMPSGHTGLVETILPHLALMLLMEEISFHFSAPGVNKADFTAAKQQRKARNNTYRLAVCQPEQKAAREGGRKSHSRHHQVEKMTCHQTMRREKVPGPTRGREPQWGQAGVGSHWNAALPGDVAQTST